MILINFKEYKQGIGKNAVKLAKICEKVSKQTKTRIIITVRAQDLINVSEAVKIPVYLQLIKDTIPAKTKGTLLNHSDHPIHNKIIQRRIKLAKKAGIKTVVCCANTKRAKALDKFKPDYIAVEPNTLIGGKISVSQAKPELISKTVKAVKTKVLVGAGIRTSRDVRRAIELGAKGVLAASAIVKAKNPEKALRALVKGLK
ncbi:triose-phosphate isomerase [Candidatus Woesearchaeota archaeon]|nr:triose-phosphate isomerase [Candidatus Woesearchaeota archaeon]